MFPPMDLKLRAGKVRNVVKLSGCKALLRDQTQDLKLVKFLLNALDSFTHLTINQIFPISPKWPGTMLRGRE